ncbi:MAG: O-methyltransferase [Bacteroidales bacterium]
MDFDTEDYLLSHIDAEGELLSRLNRDTNVMLPRAHMLSGHLQGLILKMLCRMVRPMRILEIGTFTGYSTLCFAEALPEGGVIYTIEENDELEEFINRYISESPYRDKITLIIGDAKRVVKEIDGYFDMVFIDADKREYCEYYRSIFDRVPSGGFILADNTLWGGKVADMSQHDPQTEGLRRFNNMVAFDERVEKVFFPSRDGLTVIYKK